MRKPRATAWHTVMKYCSAKNNFKKRKKAHTHRVIAFPVWIGAQINFRNGQTLWVVLRSHKLSQRERQLNFRTVWPHGVFCASHISAKAKTRPPRSLALVRGYQKGVLWNYGATIFSHSYRFLFDRVRERWHELCLWWWMMMMMIDDQQVILVVSMIQIPNQTPFTQIETLSYNYCWLRYCSTSLHRMNGLDRIVYKIHKSTNPQRAPNPCTPQNPKTTKNHTSIA